VRGRVWDAMECRDRIYCLGLGGRRNCCFFVEIVAGLRARAIKKQMKIQKLALCVSCLFREPKRSGGEIVHPEKVAKLQSSDHKLPATTPLCFGLSAQKLYGDIMFPPILKSKVRTRLHELFAGCFTKKRKVFFGGGGESVSVCRPACL